MAAGAVISKVNIDNALYLQSGPQVYEAVNALIERSPHTFNQNTCKRRLPPKRRQPAACLFTAVISVFPRSAFPRKPHIAVSIGHSKANHHTFIIK
jgi:hypothetical protein